jgi:serine/threonine-protein kinase
VPAALWADSDFELPAGPLLASAPASGGSADPLPTIGHIGRYALKSRIGEGGLGTVYSAHDPLLSRLIAIKTLHLEIAADERESFNALFINEARAAGGLSHPHIVTVFDAGISDNSAYIAMELLKGRDLRQLREEGWRPTPAQAALIVRRVADALAYAHAKGVVHRDIKPANIFMVGRTQPRVLDFGIARIAHQHDAQGSTDIAAGSPYYMAPEQARQQPVDRRADVFSLGVVFYELLTDQKPFRGSSLAEISQAVLAHNPPLAHSVDPNVPTALADIAARAMEKDPEHRYRSARAMSRELRHWLEENVAADGGQATPLPQAKPRRNWAAVALGAALVAVAGWWALSGTTGTAAREVAQPAVAPVAVVAAAAPALQTAAQSVVVATTAGMSANVSAAAPAASVATVVAPKATATTAKPVATPAARPGAAAASKESASERRAREAAERDKRNAAKPAAPLPSGTVRIAVSPWGQVEVDGKAAGTAPPLTELTLPQGRHQVTLRNEDFPPFSTTVNVLPGQPVTVKHKFGP